MWVMTGHMESIHSLTKRTHSPSAPHDVLLAIRPITRRSSSGVTGDTWNRPVATRGGGGGDVEQTSGQTGARSEIGPLLDWTGDCFPHLFQPENGGGITTSLDSGVRMSPPTTARIGRTRAGIRVHIRVIDWGQTDQTRCSGPALIQIKDRIRIQIQIQI